MLADEDHLLRAREDAQLARAAELERELAEHLVAEAVEGLDRRVVQPERRVEVDALLHPGRGLLGERHREDLVRLGGARRDEVDDTRGQHVGLARPRAGDDEERTGAVLDRATLLAGEAAEDVGLRLAKPEGELLGHWGVAGGSALR